MQQDFYVRPHDAHNETLMQNVHPTGWKNPEPTNCYNLVVLGAGTAGLVTAAGAAGLGAKVALVERSFMGGDCLNVGCVPSKGIIRSARAVYDMRIAREFGTTRSRDLSVNFGKVMERMRRLRAGISSHDSAERFSKELGVDVFFGEGKFAGSNVIEVDGKPLWFKKAAICTGARAAIPSIPGMEKTGYLTNETVFQLTKLPRRLVVIGGGPIGCELAQTFARLGSRVSLLEQGSRILPREDVDASAFVYRSLLRDGVDLRLQAMTLKATKRGRGKIVTIDERGTKVELPADEILIGVGRTPNVAGLDLEKAGIAYDLLNGVTVNDCLRTTNPRVYAAGDICSQHKFTHTADAMARMVIANALFMAKQKISQLVIPWCTYTDPEVAHVGIYEKETKEQRSDMLTLTIPLSDVDRALLDGETEGFVRIHLQKGSDKILGATIVARHAGEMMNELSLAMTAHLGLSVIGKTIHPYPTQAEAIKKAADAYNRMRITPFVKKLLVAWLKWQRS
jgi:pyruvate/2-oxoglutarate dehydrogenase complex dihydrolipoamide dehydrogenase (E3) component